MNMLKKKSCVALCVLTLAIASVYGAPLAYTPSEVSITTLSSSEDYEPFGGLMKDGSTLYFGNYDKIQTYDLTTGDVSTFAEIPRNADTKAIGKAGENIYIARDTSYWEPYPSILSVVSSSGYTDVLADTAVVTYAIFDAAVYDDNYYFAAGLGESGKLVGTNIYRFDPDNPNNPFLVAEIGGLSGGLAFDNLGNLYYASQNDGEGILCFDAAAVLVGGLTAADGVSVADFAAGHIGFLANGAFVAETGQNLAVYDLAAGVKLDDIAFTTGYEYMGKFVVGEDDTIYILSSDWSYMSDSISSLYAITLPTPGTTPVPEPTSALLIIPGLAAIWFSRRKFKFSRS